MLHLVMQDIAVLTNDASRCAYYQQESENVKGRGACIIPQALLARNVRRRRGVIPNNKEACEVGVAQPAVHIRAYCTCKSLLHTCKSLLHI